MVKKVKQGNINSYTQTLDKVRELKVPVRLILNTKTLVVLEGGSYENQVYTFDIKTTNIVQHSAANDECFTLQETEKTRFDTKTSLVFCPFGLQGTNGGANEWQNEWDYDFNLFKHQCSERRDTESYEEHRNKTSNAQMNQAKADILGKKERRIAEKLRREEVENQAKQAEKVELQAIEKEFDLEALLEKEEMEKQRKMEENLKLQIEKEKEKRQCLLKKIREKQIENQYNLRQEETDNDLDSKKDEIKSQIIYRRTLLKNKLDEIKRRSRRRQRQMQQELQGLRNQIDADLKTAYKKRHPENCKYKTQELAQDYCTKRLYKSADDLAKCSKSTIDKIEWCAVCCSYEVGSMNSDELEQCRNNCIGMNEKESKTDTKWFLNKHISEDNIKSIGEETLNENYEYSPDSFQKGAIVGEESSTPPPQQADNQPQQAPQPQAPPRVMAKRRRSK